MWPEKIKSFVKDIIAKTEGGTFSWLFDYANDSVTLKGQDFQVVLKYSYDSETCIGAFTLYYNEKNGQNYQFYTNQEWNDYNLAQRLYASAQASNLQLPF